MINITKKYQTRSGRPVRILCTDARQGAYPVIGLFQHDDGTETLTMWRADGKFEAGNKNDRSSDLEEIDPEMLARKVKAMQP